MQQTHNAPSDSFLQPKPVLIIDDHPLLRVGIESLINVTRDFEVVGSAGCAEDALALVTKYPEAIIVLDVTLGTGNGLDLLCKLRERFSHVEAIVVSSHASSEYALKSFSAGALGYVEKSHAMEELLTALRTVVNGGAYLPRKLAREVVDQLNAAS